MKFTKKPTLFLATLLLLITLCSVTVFAAQTEGATFNATDIYMTEDPLAQTPLTVEATLYFPADTATTTRGGVIVGNYKDGNTACFSFEIHKNGNPRLYIDRGANYSAIDFTFSDVNIYTGNWVHLAIVRNPSVGKATCYVDGVERQTIELASPEILTFTTSACIGGDERSGNAQYFKGRLKNVSLYSDIRSASEIASDCATTTLDTDNLIGYYEIESGKTSFADKNGSGPSFNTLWFTDKEPVTDYAYSFAVVGDTQKLLYNTPEKFPLLYDWIVENAEDKKMEYVIGLGDITDKDLDWEWEIAVENIDKLNGVVPYSLIRGNHDSAEQFVKYLPYSKYGSTVTDSYNGDMLNTYHKFTVGETKYMLVNLDLGPSDDVLDWANNIISQNPDHNVIISTHIYLYHDGTTLDAGDNAPATKCGGYNNGDDIWDKLVRKHENIVLVLSGHDPYDQIITTQTQGDNGNIVTQMLIDPQDTDKIHGGVGMVAMFYFSEDGTVIDVEYYSTVRDQYLLEENQFTLKLDTLEHNYNSWTATETEHWVECSDCDDIAFRGTHTGGVATYEKKAVCEVCNTEYGEYGEKNVVYIADTARGKGDGSSPENALGRADGYDNTVAKAFMNDSLYRALTANDNELLEQGGYIVIVGETTIDNADVLRTTSHAEWQWPSVANANKITITSCYNGTDYKTQGAKLVLDTSKYAINILVNNPTVWQNIDIEAKYDSSRKNGVGDVGLAMISFCGNDTVIGQDVNVIANDVRASGDKVIQYPNLVGYMRLGTKNAASLTNTNITIYSGKWNAVYGGGYGTRISNGDQYGSIKGDVNVTVFGGEIGTVYGTSSHRAENITAKVTGNVNITLDGGKITEVYASNHNGIDGKINLTITEKATGLTKAWSYYPTTSNSANAPTDATVTYHIGSIDPENLLYFTQVNVTGKDGWQYENNTWYYYENGEKVKNDWRIDSTGWCYLDAEGKWVKNAFVRDSVGWAYITPDGYYYDTKNGWLWYNNGWYYLENGYAVTNQWRLDSVGWCYLSETGLMVTNGLVRDSVGLSYIGNEGYFVEYNGWLLLEGKWYYLEKGYAVTNDWRKDSRGWCFLDENGEWVLNAFVRDTVGLAYITEDGYFYDNVNGWILFNDEWYYLEKGYAVTNDWRLDSVGWCYLGKDGAMYTSTWLKDSVGWCYIDENGYCLANGTYTVEGHEYTFDADGRIQGEPITA